MEVRTRAIRRRDEQSRNKKPCLNGELKIDVEASCFPIEDDAEEGEASSQVLKAAVSGYGREKRSKFYREMRNCRQNIPGSQTDAR